MVAYVYNNISECQSPVLSIGWNEIGLQRNRIVFDYFLFRFLVFLCNCFRLCCIREYGKAVADRFVWSCNYCLYLRSNCTIIASYFAFAFAL